MESLDVADDTNLTDGSVKDRAMRLCRFVTTSEFLFFSTLFSSFLSMGLVLAVIGPSLLELGAQTGASMAGLVYIFSARSTGHSDASEMQSQQRRAVETNNAVADCGFCPSYALFS